MMHRSPTMKWPRSYLARDRDTAAGRCVTSIGETRVDGSGEMWGLLKPEKRASIKGMARDGGGLTKETAWGGWGGEAMSCGGWRFGRQHRGVWHMCVITRMQNCF